MTGFLNAHGTNPNLFSGEFQDLDFGLADDVACDDHREVSKWASVEELAIDFDFEDRMHAVIDDNSADFEDNDDFDDELDMTTWSSSLLGSDYHDDIEDWHYNTMSDDDIARIESEEADKKLEYELAEADSYMPSFSSNRDKRTLDWSEADYRWWRYYRNCKDRKPAQFRVDGKRARKDSPRWSIRHVQVERSDWYHLEYHGEHDYVFEEWSAQAVSTFGIEVVDLTEDEASYYEAEFERECAYHRIKYVECRSDNSNVFDPTTNAKMVQEVWERHLFLERFGVHRPYRFSPYYWDDYDTYDYGAYDCRDDSYNEDYRLTEDEYEDTRYDDGPTIEEWTEIDQLEIERLLDEEADNYFPSFGSSVPKRKVYGYDIDAKHGFARNKAHTADRGWRRFSPKKHHGRDSIRFHN